MQEHGRYFYLIPSGILWAALFSVSKSPQTSPLIRCARPFNNIFYVCLFLISIKFIYLCHIKYIIPCHN